MDSRILTLASLLLFSSLVAVDAASYLNTTTIPSATTTVSYFSQGPPPTGPEIVGWCSTNYNLYYSRFATSTSTTSTTYTGTATYLNGASTVTTSYTLDYPIFSTLMPTPYSAPPECYQGCYISAQEVQIKYWPTPKANATITAAPTITEPSIPVTDVINGTTYVSPSVYATFISLFAADCPWGGGDCSTIGSVISATMLSFSSDAILSQDCLRGKNAVDYRDFNLPISWSVVSNQYDCTVNGAFPNVQSYTSHAGDDPDYDYTLNPLIYFPTGLTSTINLDWASCTFLGGVHDPPYALSAVAPLLPEQTITSPPLAPPPSAPTAEAQSPVAPSIVDPTTPPSPPDLPGATPPADPPADPPATKPADPPADPPASTPPADPQTNDPTQAAPGGPHGPPVTKPIVGDPPMPSQGGDPPANHNPPVIGSQTLQPGGPPITNSGTVYSQLPSGGGASVIVSGKDGVSTVPIASVKPTTSSPAVVGSQTLMPGGDPVTVSGTIYSQLPSESGGSVVIQGPNGISTLPASNFQHPITQRPAIIGSQTLQPGGSPITVSGSIYSLDPSGNSVVVNGPQGASTLPVANFQPILIGSQTLQPGVAITSAGTIYSLAPSGGGVVVSGPNGVVTIPPASFIPPNTAAVIGTQTLTPGSAITLSGTVYSLDPSGSSVIVSSPNGVSTVPVASFIPTPTAGVIPSAIASVMGITQTAAVTSVTVIQGSTYVVVGTSTLPAASASNFLSTGLWTLPGTTHVGNSTATSSVLQASSATRLALGLEALIVVVAGAFVALL